MFEFLSKLVDSEQKRRLRLLAKTNEPVLQQFLTSELIDKTKAIKDISFLALDLETTGLNAKQDQILSVGYVEVNQGKIQLNSSNHLVIQTNQQLAKDNVSIHQLTDSEVAQGQPLSDVLKQLYDVMRGKVLIVHYQKIERTFLQAASQQVFGIAPELPFVDTLKIAKHQFDRTHTEYDPSALRLANLRQRYDLPSFSSHNAFNDALATAELFLTLVKHHHQGLNTPLNKLL